SVCSAKPALSPATFCHADVDKFRFLAKFCRIASLAIFRYAGVYKPWEIPRASTIGDSHQLTLTGTHTFIPRIGMGRHMLPGKQQTGGRYERTKPRLEKL